ncbi:MAG TPA: hypothetical protein PLK55_02525 [archaeon]|jgi:hypothetical protein|nr:hypothetical protein [archaeon]
MAKIIDFQKAKAEVNKNKSKTLTVYIKEQERMIDFIGKSILDTLSEVYVSTTIDEKKSKARRIESLNKALNDIIEKIKNSGIGRKNKILLNNRIQDHLNKIEMVREAYQRLMDYYIKEEIPKERIREKGDKKRRATRRKSFAK